MIQKRRVFPLLAVSLLASLAVACGVEGANDETVDPGPAVTTTVPDGTTTTEADGTTTTEADTTTTEPDVTTTTEADTTTTTIGDDETDYQDIVLQSMIDTWIEGGLSQEQAECLADSYGRDILDGVEMSASDMQQYLADCNVSASDLN